MPSLHCHQSDADLCLSVPYSMHSRHMPQAALAICRSTHRVQPPRAATARSQQLQGGPDISRLAPHLQQEWDHERNAHLGPIRITPGSNRKVWWTQGLCQSGQPHKWTARIQSRTRGRGCPYGKGGNLACPCNDLAHNHTAVAAELDLHPGNPRTAESFRASSHQKVPWRCGVCSHSGMLL